MTELHLRARSVTELVDAAFSLYRRNAMDYIVQTTNVRRTNEYPGGGSAHWEANATYTDGIIVQHFDFGGTSTDIQLKFNLYTDQTVNTGHAKMEGSLDGLTWILLGDRPFGSTPGITDYNLSLPASLLGDSDLWLRATMRTEGPAGFAPDFAQFSRSPSPELNPTTPVFSITANVPEPASSGLILLGSLLFFARCRSLAAS